MGGLLTKYDNVIIDSEDKTHMEDDRAQHCSCSGMQQLTIEKDIDADYDLHFHTKIYYKFLELDREKFP